MNRVSIRSSLLGATFVMFFLAGFTASEINQAHCRLPKQLKGRSFYDIGDAARHNYALREFWSKYQRGVGFCAIRQVVQGFEGPIVVYLVTQDGNFTGYIERHGFFSNVYKEICVDSPRIGYEDETKRFIEIDPEIWDAVDLVIRGGGERQN